MSQQLSTNTFTVAKWVVSPDATQGTHTTIQAAINSASSGDNIFIRPGTYTEDLTLKVGVNITGLIGDANEPTVTVIGNATFTGTGAATITGIRLQTNGGALITVSGSNASILKIRDCYLNCTNATGISFTSSNAAATISVIRSFMDLGTTGIALYSMTSPGTLNLNYTQTTNSGASTTQSSNSAGIVNIQFCIMASPIACSSTGVIQKQYALIDTSAQNATSFTTAGTGSSVIRYGDLLSGSASAVSIGAGSTVRAFELLVNSSNTNAITGAGTIRNGVVTYTGGSSTNNVTTQLPVTGVSVRGTTVSVSTDANAATVNVGTGAAIKATTIGSTTTGSTTAIQTPSGVAATATSGLTATTGDVTISSGNLVVSSGILNVTNAAGSGATLFETEANANGFSVDQRKIRGSSIVQSGDSLGRNRFMGWDGTQYVVGAQIRSIVNGTPGVNRVGADLEFYTHPDSTSGGTLATQRMVIASTGEVTINTPDSGTGLTVSGGGITSTNGSITVSAGSVVISTGNLLLPTTSSTQGQIQLNGVRVYHGYGTGNDFFGQNAGNFTLTTGSATFNTACGDTALQSLTTGSQNMAVGTGAGNKVDTGSLNAFIGVNAGQNVAGGSENTVIGQASLNALTTGSYNTVIGRNSGNAYTTSESSNIIIGRSVTGTAAESNTLRIGAGTGTGAGQLAAAFIQGISGVTVASSAAVLINTSTGQLGTVASSARYKENIQDITQSNIMKLRPVSFNFKTDDTKATNYGFIAEEVAEHMPELVVYNTKGEPETIQYHQMYALLLKEIQNLKKEVEELKTQRNINE